MSNLEDFIIESNNIEGEGTSPEWEIPVYYKFLSEPLSEESVKRFHRELCDARGQLREGARGVYRKVPVFVGGKEMPNPGTLRRLMSKFWDGFAYRTPYENHKLYESIHPFVDLNGRTGRAIWLHQMGGAVRLGFLHIWYYQSLDHE